MDDGDLERLVDRADLDELVRCIDGLCAARSWEDLFRLRNLTRSAITSGRQVWPATTLAEYRLALLAPGAWATRVVHEDASRFSIGPLTEVIAQNHTWSEVADHLERGPQRDFVAHERALRGDAIDAVQLDTRVLDIPVTRQHWEPEYSFPVYGDVGVVHLCPIDGDRPSWRSIQPVQRSEIDQLLDEDTDDALRRLVEPWTATSAGSACSIVVEGDEAAALAFLENDDVDLAEIEPRQALHWLVWCGASGGAHGRRRGMASGRFGAWWLLAALGGLIDEWDTLQQRGELADALGDTLHSFTWSRWRTVHRHGYELRVLARDDDEGITIGLSAHEDAETAPAAESAAL